MRKSSPEPSGESGLETSFWGGGSGSGLGGVGEGVFGVGGSCRRDGGAEEGVYVVSSLLKSLLVGVETMVKRLRRGEREEKTAERETMFYSRRT